MLNSSPKNIFNGVEMSFQFRDALNLFESNKKNLLILGAAGTGKSTLLKLLKKTTQRKVAFLSPTGISALHIGGQTIHSFFRLPPILLNAEVLRSIKPNYMLKRINTLVIDEISMVRADVMDAMDFLLKRDRKSEVRFGGVKIAFFGDIFQLPPVVSSREEAKYLIHKYGGIYFFNSLVFQNIKATTEIIELTKIYRQNEKHFLSILKRMRLNQMDYDDLTQLNERVTKVPDDEGVITLSPRRILVDSINQKKLNQISNVSFRYIAKMEGRVNPSQVPAPEVLELKEGAQVMFVKNDPERRYVNGTLGIVSRCNADNIEIRISSNEDTQLIEVKKEIWETIKYKAERNSHELKIEIVGSFVQYPLKLAWAMTIHKSQGKTFDKVCIDLGKGAFESGQTYVAFSRCRSLEGVYLQQALQMSDIMLDPRLVEFYEEALLG